MSVGQEPYGPHSRRPHLSLPHRRRARGRGPRLNGVRLGAYPQARFGKSQGVASTEGAMDVRANVPVASGLWLARPYSREKRVWHEALIDFSGWLVPSGACGGVLELVPAGPRRRWLSAAECEQWEHLNEVHGIAGAITSLQYALSRPEMVTHSGLFNNCQSFARWVAYGRHESPQVTTGVLCAGVVVALCAAQPKPTRRRRSPR
jgi:hypothetical protein